MCTIACLDFGRENLPIADVKGKKVIEIGSVDVNGSLRSYVEALEPERYIGVDLEEGKGVDEVCNVYDLVEHFGPESFDLVITTEMIEHVQDWRKAFSQIKRIMKPGGIVLLTTRSYGFPYHEYPFDYWRFEVDDMKAIFSDMEIVKLETDAFEPGVFVKARKPLNSYKENDLSEYALYSMVSRTRSKPIEFSKRDYFLLGIRNSFVVRKFNGAKRRLFDR